VFEPLEVRRLLKTSPIEPPVEPTDPHDVVTDPLTVELSNSSDHRCSSAVANYAWDVDLMDVFGELGRHGTVPLVAQEPLLEIRKPADIAAALTDALVLDIVSGLQTGRSTPVAPALPNSSTFAPNVAQDGLQHRIESLIQQLGDEDPAVREKAQAELEQIGRPAAAALKKASEDADAERRARAQAIRQKLHSPDTRFTEFDKYDEDGNPIGNPIRTTVLDKLGEKHTVYEYGPNAELQKVTLFDWSGKPIRTTEYFLDGTRRVTEYVDGKPAGSTVEGQDPGTSNRSSAIISAQPPGSALEGYWFGSASALPTGDTPGPVQAAQQISLDAHFGCEGQVSALLKQDANPDGSVTVVIKDKDGRVIGSVTTWTDKQGRVTKRVTTRADRTSKVEERTYGADGSHTEKDTERDALGRTTSSEERSFNDKNEMTGGSRFRTDWSSGRPKTTKQNWDPDTKEWRTVE
jgi:hypothetical protein